MEQINPDKYRCNKDCIYRNNMEKTCTFGQMDIPHPKEGHQCLYPRAIQEQSSNTINYKNLAAKRWNPEKEPPKLQRLLRIVSDAFNLH